MSVKPGTLARYRERDWVVLPSDDPQLLLLRPIGGSGREVCGVLKPLSDLIAYSLEYERVKPAQFPLPDPSAVQDHAAVRLTVEAARLLLREGAAPFRSLGHLSIRPRPYQFVPLLMALRLDTVRLLIADDVGVGKTIEAGLIAREMLDRGEVRRVGILCPPYLCDQWQKELAEKFHLDAVVIRSGTVSRLERQAPPDRSVFQHYRHFIASIDLVKGDRYTAQFLQHCPDLVLVDEVHGAAQPPGDRRSTSQQQRHELLKKVAANARQNLILLTATPHSGVEESFSSILGLVKPEFRTLSIGLMTEQQRTELARHFVQRRRPDVMQWMGEETPFPDRDDKEIDQPYKFSAKYREFYEDVYKFAREIVRKAESLTGWKQRMRFWSALALLRCVTSSPAAAATALVKRAGSGEDSVTNLDATLLASLENATNEEIDQAYQPVVQDPFEAEAVVDVAPSSVFEAQEQDPDWGERERKRLREFAREAASLYGQPDAKLEKLISVIKRMLRDGYHPIVWCRYIATANYVAKELHSQLSTSFRDLAVAAVTGEVGDDERKLKVEELEESRRRVLVATDCLSEGINLQEHFNAVAHYDLPWNPNRLEQREGRVDRFGQQAKMVKVVWIYGQDNPVDGAVLEVLLRKARDIHRALGIHVPVPIDSETVVQAVLRSLFAHEKPTSGQLMLFDEIAQAKTKYSELADRAAEREKENRTRFAQRAIKPEEVEQELKETDAVLGDPKQVQSFLAEVSQRLSIGFHRIREKEWQLRAASLPGAVQHRIGTVSDLWRITFDSPTPEGLTFIGRNHPLIEGLAEHVLDLAFNPPDANTPVARSGVIRTRQVERRTTLLLLRLRYLQREGDDARPTLAEETLTWGFTGAPPNIALLAPEEAQQLFDEACPSGNVPLTEKRQSLGEASGWWESIQPHLCKLLETRSEQLENSHRRVRRVLKQVKVRLEAQPPDLLGMVVLLPVPHATQG